MQEAPQLLDVCPLLCGPEDPQLELRLHVVHPALDFHHLPRQFLAVEEYRGVREADAELGEILHVEHHVDGVLQVRNPRLRSLPHLDRVPHRHLRENGYPVVASAADEEVSLAQLRVLVRAEYPSGAPPYRDCAEPCVALEAKGAEGLPNHLGIRGDAGPYRGLPGLRQGCPHGAGEPYVSQQNLGYVSGGVGDLLRRLRYLQYAGHGLRVLDVSHAQHRRHPDVVYQLVDFALELVNLLGDFRGVEQYCGVGQVQHELGLVLHLREQVLQAPWLVLYLPKRHRQLLSPARY